MVMLVFIRDLGSSLMFFGGFLALLYVATNRLLVPGRRPGAVRRRARGSSATHGRPRHDRVDAWQHPFDPALYDRIGGSYQIAQSLFAQADGGVCRAGLRRRRSLKVGDRRQALLPGRADRPHLRGDRQRARASSARAGCCCVYLLVVERGFKIAMLARDSFSKLLADGPDAVFALQVFVIVGGVTQGHPADRRDAAVRLLRRLVDRRQLRAARAAAADLRPRAARGVEPR